MIAAAFLAVVFIGCAIASFVIAPAKPSPGFADGAAVLAFVSSAAIAIERVIEGFFTALSGWLGQWWPFALARKEFDRFEKETNGLLGPVLKQTIDELAAAKAAAGSAGVEAERIQGVIDGLVADQKRLSKHYSEVTSKLAAGSMRLARVGEINLEISKKLDAVHQAEAGSIKEAGKMLAAATDTADRASLILASLQDNPARRIAALLLGASLGMLVAGGVGLNVFIVTLSKSPTDSSNVPSALAGALGILLTGIVIGLGSAPSHEIVRSLQAYRDSRTDPDTMTVPSTAARRGNEESVADGSEMPTNRRSIRRTS